MNNLSTRNFWPDGVLGPEAQGGPSRGGRVGKRVAPRFRRRRFVIQACADRHTGVCRWADGSLPTSRRPVAAD
jgi:hypothetical protein